MSIEKKDTHFVVRFITPLLEGSVVFLPLSLVIIILWKPKHLLLEIVVFGFLVVALLTSYVALCMRILSSYRCPQCQANLPKHKGDLRYSDHRFYCKKCDVIWKTGIPDLHGSYPI